MFVEGKWNNLVGLVSPPDWLDDRYVKDADTQQNIEILEKAVNNEPRLCEEQERKDPAAVTYDLEKSNALKFPVHTEFIINFPQRED